MSLNPSGATVASVQFWSPSFSTTLTQSSARTLSRNISPQFERKRCGGELIEKPSDGHLYLLHIRMRLSHRNKPWYLSDGHLEKQQQKKETITIQEKALWKMGILRVKEEVAS